MPTEPYNLVVVGGGTAGLVCAAGAAGLGARVALIERDRLGGECLYTGCVPSKTLIASARARLGFGAAMARVRAAIDTIAPHDSPERFRSLGVDVVIGDARFDGPGAITVAGRRIGFRRAVIATGSRPSLPAIPGLVAPLTSDTVFQLTSAPARLAVIGGGAVGCELAQAFQRLGVAVTLYHDQPRVLEREDADASAIVARSLARDGVEVRTNTRVAHASELGDAAILVATGRRANTEGLGLEQAGVAVADDGRVRVDDFLCTTNPRVFACGDVCLPWKFTHAADAAARIVVQNALFAAGPLGRRRLSALTMPSCTYTDPEVAHVGAREGDVYAQPYTGLDRAVTDAATDGFVKIYARPGTGTIVGATIVGPHAGDIISEISVAIAGGVSLAGLANVIHPYPTYAEAIRKCGDAYNRTRLTPAVRSLLRWWLR